MIETDRLVMRPFEPGDLDEYAAIVSDAEVVRYLPVGTPRDRAAAWREMALCAGHLALRGYSQYAVIAKESRTLIGRGGLWNPEGWPGLEVGWILGRSAWGRGYATELGLAWRDYAFNELHATELVSVIHPENAGSIKVAERIGHRYLRDVVVADQRALLYGQQR